MKDFLVHTPVTVSLFTLVHYRQPILNPFAYFDYGCEKNQMIYNQCICEPPLIPLNKIRLEKFLYFTVKVILRVDQLTLRF